MPTFCGVVNCGSRGTRDLVNFYRLPSELSLKHKQILNDLSKLRRQKWLEAIRRADLTETKLKYLRVCSKHFISGKPSKLQDTNSPDWVPSLLMGYTAETSVNDNKKSKLRADRKKQLIEVPLEETMEESSKFKMYNPQKENECRGAS